MFRVVKRSNMVAESTYVMYFILWLCSSGTIQIRSGAVVMAATTDPSIEATAPMKSVKENGILALHCKVTKHNIKTHKISINRQVIGEPEEWLAIDKNVIAVNDARVFLASRRLSDRTVYFLTITRVTPADEGIYICKLLSSNNVLLDSSSVSIEVMYFPKANPKCTPSAEQLYVVNEGVEVTFNCSSEKANPPVVLKWSRTPSDKTSPTFVEVYSDDEDITYSIVTFIPTRRDRSVMFTCRVTSAMFTDKDKTPQQCHVGPLRVTQDDDYYREHMPPSRPIATTPYPLVHYGVKYNKPTYINHTITTTDDCHDYCAEMTQRSVSNWTMATLIAGLLALFFFIFGIILLIKYCIVDDMCRRETIPGTPPTDDINIHGMEYRIDGNRLYMTLERPGPSQTEVLYQRGEVFEREYLGTPIRDIEVIAIGPNQQEGHISSPSDKGDPENKLKTPTPEEAECTIAVSPTEQFERKSSMAGTPTKGEQSEKESDLESIGTPTGMLSIYGTPTRGESERLLNGTPTLPPRRYRSKSHYV